MKSLVALLLLGFAQFAQALTCGNISFKIETPMQAWNLRQTFLQRMQDLAEKMPHTLHEDTRLRLARDEMPMPEQTPFLKKTLSILTAKTTHSGIWVKGRRISVRLDFNLVLGSSGWEGNNGLNCRQE